MSVHDVYDLVIVWWGVTGTALLYTMAKYSSISRMAIIEKDKEVGLGNSANWMNSQTLHDGSIETNYSFAKAKIVKGCVQTVKNYVTKTQEKYPTTRLYHLQNKMVIAVWDQEVAALTERFEQIKSLYSDISFLHGDQIATIEPNVMKARPAYEPIVAVSSPYGYAIDFWAVSASFVEEAKHYTNKKIDVLTGTEVMHIEKKHDYYIVTLNTGVELRSKTIVVSAGGYTPYIAQQLWYAQDISILSIAWNFYLSNKKLLNGKVYTMQKPKLPFAAVHGDADVHDADQTRFGPTAKGIMMLERYNWKSIIPYFSVFGLFKWWSYKTLFSILSDITIIAFLARNFVYELPYIGKGWFVQQEVRKVVPSAQYDDISLAPWYGWTRPQILDTKNGKMDLGEARIQGDHIIFNITPSPGASTCLGNAYRDGIALAQWLDIDFDTEAYKKDLVDDPEAFAEFTKTFS